MMAMNLSRTISMGRCRADRAVASASKRQTWPGRQKRQLGGTLGSRPPGTGYATLRHANVFDQRCDDGDGQRAIANIKWAKPKNAVPINQRKARSPTPVA